MRNVTFPHLGLSFDFDPVAFRIGSLSIRWYALIIAFGFLLALIYCVRRAKRFGVDVDRLTDVVLGGLIGGIIGARLYYVLFKLDYYAANPLRIFEIWEGGLAIYGGIIGALLVGWLIARWRKLRFAPVLDLAGLGFLIGQGVGRWANFINVEAFGSNTDLPWGMGGTAVSSYLSQHAAELSGYGVTVDPAAPVHPTFLYESLWCLLGFLLLHFYSKRRKFDGEVFLFYSIWYGVGRFVIEGLRTDSLMLGRIRISQLLAAVIVFAAVVIWLFLRAKIRRDPSSRLAVLYVDTPEAKEALEGTREKGKRRGKAAEASSEEPAETEETEAAETEETETSESEEIEPAETEEIEPAESEEIEPAESEEIETAEAEETEKPDETEPPEPSEEDTEEKKESGENEDGADH